MPDYRLYLIGSAGHVESVEDIIARSDDEAIEASSSSGRDGKRRALWCDSRLITEWEIVELRQAGLAR